MPGSPPRLRSGAPSVASRWASALIVWGVLALLPACRPAAAGDVASLVLPRTDFQAVREALIESIEEEGLVVSAVIPFNDMLQRTAAASASSAASPFMRAEIVQFCSSRIAWQLLTEDRAQIALCPLSISIQQTRDAPGEVRLAWREAGGSSPGRIAADALLTRLIRRAEALAR